MVEINWTNAALSDLNEIGEYIAKDSIRYAELTVSTLYDAVEILKGQPFLGNMVEEFRMESLRQLIKGDYRIIYRIVNKARIDILTVHHCSRLIHNTYPFTSL